MIARDQAFENGLSIESYGGRSAVSVEIKDDGCRGRVGVLEGRCPQSDEGIGRRGVQQGCESAIKRGQPSHIQRRGVGGFGAIYEKAVGCRKPTRGIKSSSGSHTNDVRIS